MGEWLLAVRDEVERRLTARFAQGAEGAERLIFLNRRERRRFKKRSALRAFERTATKRLRAFYGAGLSPAP